MMSNFDKESYASVGERIYLTGRSESGASIEPIGGHHHMQMHGGSCATCHGANREGGTRMWPWFWETAPAITPKALTGEHESDGHTHELYSRDSLKKAIVEGVNPEGAALDESMPRWRMSGSDLDALVDYLLPQDDY
jgi:mono/diheme cytochrome c family protein